jgi:hypothetical protein
MTTAFFLTFPADRVFRTFTIQESRAGFDERFILAAVYECQESKLMSEQNSLSFSVVKENRSPIFPSLLPRPHKKGCSNVVSAIG